MAASPPNHPALDQFLAQIAPIAKQLGVTTLIIVAQDPKTGEKGFFGATEAMSELRDFIDSKFNEKLGMVAETSWEA
jgi:hypothetical protein